MANNLNKPGQLLFANWDINLDKVPIEQLDHYIAVENYLTDNDEPPPDAAPIEQVRGYLEAFYHLCEVEDWEKASAILSLRLNTSTNEKLHDQLDTWGYYHELVNLYSKILGKLSSSWDAIFFTVWVRFTTFWETIPKR